MGTVKDLTGQNFGRWKVLGLSELRRTKRQAEPYWLCRCNCGTERAVRGNELKRGSSTSCGCYQRERAAANTKHGFARAGQKAPTYRVWRNMIRRCYEQANPDFGRYGGRGIVVCERWRHDFVNFLTDMGEKPAGYSIERIDFDGDYTPKNCKWLPFREQRLNQSNTIWVEHDGERLPLKHFARKIGVPYEALLRRVNRGQNHMDAVAVLKAR